MRPPFSISQITTLGATFEADLRAYAAAGVDGIGIWEIKLPEGGDEQAHEQRDASGLGRAAAVPAVPSILPLPLMDGPTDPSERIEAICASVHRRARFEPSSVVCLTGPGDNRDTLVEGLRTVTVLLSPWLPESSVTRLDALGTPDLALSGAALNGGRVQRVSPLEPLFPKPS